MFCGAWRFYNFWGCLFKKKRIKMTDTNLGAKVNVGSENKYQKIFLKRRHTTNITKSRKARHFY
jgi:hypothetical protein